MRCAQVQELFSEIYDGIAEAGATRHLLDCPACAAEYKRYSQLLDELKQLPEPELPAGFHETMMDKIREIALSDVDTVSELKVIAGGRKGDAKPRQQATKKAASISRRWAGVAAAACVLLMSLWAVRVFELPGARFANDSAAYNMAMPQAESVAPDMAMPPADSAVTEFELFAGAIAEEEPMYELAMDEPIADEMFDADLPPDCPRQRNMFDDADDDEYFSVEHAPQEVSPSVAPVDDDDYALWYDFSEAVEEESDLQVGIARNVGEEEYGEMDFAEVDSQNFRWYTGEQEPAGRGGDYQTALDVAPFEPIAITLREYGTDDFFFTLELTGNDGLSPWDIAFAVGIIILCIAIGALLWGVYKNKAKERQNR